MKKMSKGKTYLLGGIIVAIAMVFSITSINARSYVYVNDNASGSMDGSEDHPYDEIQTAIDVADDKDRDVFVFNGFYEENIEIWDDIKVVGEERGGVIIEAKDDDEPVVVMYDDSEISNLQIQKGRYGVRVKKWAEAEINECDIVDNDKDGIKAREAETNDKGLLEVYDSYIARNEKSGIYSEKRQVYIEECTIEDNEKDGIDLAKGTEGKLKNNKIKGNEGVGIKLTIDGSDIEVKGSTIRNNDYNGVEVRSEGYEGYILLNENKYYKNDFYGIARVEAAPFSDYDWSQNMIIEGGIYWDNDWAGISHFIRVY